MPDYIGTIEVPAVTASGVFPIVPDYGHGVAIEPDVAIHQFGAANHKIEQRILLGPGVRKYVVKRASLSLSDLAALKSFWEARKGSYQPFTYNAPLADGSGTTAVTVRFAEEPLSWQMIADYAATVGVTLVEVPTATPTYTVASTITRFPNTQLTNALAGQVQQIIPLLTIQPREAGYPAIYLSDRRATVGGQLCLPRVLAAEGIRQAIDGESDTARFTLGNADRVMRDLAAAVNLHRASVSFALYHVGSQTKLNLWKGEVVTWRGDETPAFVLEAGDPLYELRLQYPARTISRSCWKTFKKAGQCDYVGGLTSCNKSWSDCQERGRQDQFGGIMATPQSVRIRETGSKLGRRMINSTSLVNDTVYGAPLQEVYTDNPMPVKCLVVSGREEEDFYAAIGIVGQGPIGGYDGDGIKHRLDGQPPHGPLPKGLRRSYGHDPVQNNAPDVDSDEFSISDSQGVGFTGDRAAGVAFVEIRRTDPKGTTLSRVQEHDMTVVVNGGLGGWYWEDAATRSWASVNTNPIWIAVNMVLRAKGLQDAAKAEQEKHFDVESAIACAAICGDLPPRIVAPAAMRVSFSGSTATWVSGDKLSRAMGGMWLKVGNDRYYINSVTLDEFNEPVSLEMQTTPGDGQFDVEVCETQFKFRGVIGTPKPLKDWLRDVLNSCLAGFTFRDGKLAFYMRTNSSAVEAFTTGNMILGSLRLEPLAPGFNELEGVFNDEEFDYSEVPLTVYDEPHRNLYGPSRAQVALPGVSSRSRAARIIATRLREELGGINESEWRKARRGRFSTSVLGLTVEPGMVCSATHEDMPGGAGEFRITSWELKSDYSIDVEFRTTTDSMYDLTVGPKPADVVPAAPPTELYRELVPGAVRPIGANAFNVTVGLSEDSNGVKRRQFDITYDPPLPLGTFSGVHCYIKTPDGKAHDCGGDDYNGDGTDTTPGRYGTRTMYTPPPAAQETWEIYLVSKSPTLQNKLVTTGAPSARSPYRTVVVDPVDPIGGGGTPAPAVDAVTASAVVQDDKWGVAGTIDWPADTSNIGMAELWLQKQSSSDLEIFVGVVPIGQANYASGVVWPRSLVSTQWKARIITYNPEGAPTLPGVLSGAFTLDQMSAGASTISSLAFTETVASGSTGQKGYKVVVTWNVANDTDILNSFFRITDWNTARTTQIGGGKSRWGESRVYGAHTGIFTQEAYMSGGDYGSPAAYDLKFTLYYTLKDGVTEVEAVSSWVQIRESSTPTRRGDSIAPGTVPSTALQDGALSDLSKYGSNARPAALGYGLPLLPSTSYPIGALFVNLNDGRVYRNVSGVWKSVQNPADMEVGTLAFGVAYGGTINVAQVNAGTFTGQGIDLTRNGIRTLLNNDYAEYAYASLISRYQNQTYPSSALFPTGLVGRNPSGYIGAILSWNANGGLLELDNSYGQQFFVADPYWQTVKARSSGGYEIVLDVFNQRLQTPDIRITSQYGFECGWFQGAYAEGVVNGRVAFYTTVNGYKSFVGWIYVKG